MVEDSTGAVIPGTTIKLTNTDTGAVLTASSSEEGNFSFPAQPRGNYRVEASRDGFQTTAQNFTLRVSQTQSLDRTWLRGYSDSDRGDRRSAAGRYRHLVGRRSGRRRQVTELPLNGRNFTQLALLPRA